mmetsp:Transcript_39364/g.47725  ORF Transcript_39364/g.47725 Transcript_39364/m.47725 type:complete len:538 (-) Transcript_39364:26-1639(-)|eukprot:CAMPEP_0197849540 /NCGR_PEP_ID=MMETSP1438-20131217/12533_1 /TAXON_ID=1461541 /ORGANISM="Pterosperma sp., Strain CCMP1384" /LENGTH=537 /DNA_ID=CAMNT_0043462287 /DNA_START=144 /DNA_END=1757 /DNA_ORIENTATION=+
MKTALHLRWFSLLLCIVVCVAIPRHPYRKLVTTAHKGQHDTPSVDKSLLPPQHFITQLLDHFNQTEGGATYQQRYFVNDTFFDGTGPVFLCVGGEGPELTPEVVVTGTVHCGLLMTYAAQVKALVFAVEHRYYGQSIPTPDLSTENLRWLSAKQALADLAAFVQHQNKQHNLTAGNKWISWGGSYPGMLAGWLRLKYPDLVHGAVASSAPVHAIANFQGYNDVVAASMSAPIVGGSTGCGDAIKKAFMLIGEELTVSTSRRSLELTFNVCKSEKQPLDHVNEQMIFTENLAGVFPVQENDPACTQEACNIRSICNIMMDSSLGGPIQSLAKLSNIANSGACMDVSYTDSILGLLNVTKAGGTDRVWFHQTCNEFGFYQTCDPTTQCIFTQHPWLNNLTSNYKQCQLAFGISGEQVEKNIKATNEYFGGRSPDGSRILFVNGQIDPWHAASIVSSVSPSEPALWCSGASHHAWTHVAKPTDQPEVVEVRKKILAQVADWLSDSQKNDTTKLHIPREHLITRRRGNKHPRDPHKLIAMV